MWRKWKRNNVLIIFVFVYMNEIEQVTSVARGISEYGILVMIAAFFLVFVAGGLVWDMRSSKKPFSSGFYGFLEQMKSPHAMAGEDSAMMVDIAEGLLPETQLRIKNTTGVYFDLATEKVCRLIKRIREENHIIDREATRTKIRTLLCNLYDDRNSRFDSYTYRGKKLSEYANPEWVEWVAKVVEGEIYNESGANNGRAYTNVSAVYDKIKIDFYHRLNDI